MLESSSVDPNAICKRDGYWWPAKDVQCWPWLQNEQLLPAYLAERCPRKGMVLHAGGNCGFYTKLYAELFARVITFEPDPLNFACLAMNTLMSNVTKFQAVLGNKRAWVGMLDAGINVGAHRIGMCVGDTMMMTIDELDLPYLDLLHLDIEGFELPAFEGAAKTIERCRPVIALEAMNHGSFYGYSDAELFAWLEHKGYRLESRPWHEAVFVPEDRNA